MMPRIFVNKSILIGEMLTIGGSDGHHFVRVLRANLGEKLVVAARNGPFLAVIMSIEGKSGILTIQVESSYPSHEPACRLVVVQSLAKGDKMDIIIQKCTEIGVSHLICYQAKRSVLSLGTKADQKLARWRRIALEAACQAQRDIVPNVSYADTIESLCSCIQPLQVCRFLMLDETQTTVSLRSVLDNHGTIENKTVVLAIGPEGGWDEDERDKIQTMLNGISVTLGPRILRTETAGIAAAVVVLYHFGQFGV